ncbi:hypothetical protein RB594_004027 [Gaeumannomyces avenae]
MPIYPDSERVVDSDGAPDAESIQVPDIRIEPPPSDTGRAASSSISATILPPLPTTPLASKKVIPHKARQSEEISAPAESKELSPPASSITTSPDFLYKEIKALKKRPDGRDGGFVPDHSLKDLFRKLGAHLRNLETLRGTHHIDEIIPFICNQAPKAFATLVFSGHVHLIVCLFDNGIDDTLLPVTTNTAGELRSFPAEARVELAEMAVMLANEEVSRIKDVDIKTIKMKEDARAQAIAASELAASAREDAIVAAAFEPWPPMTLDHFHEIHQWPFFAPVFDGAQFYNMFAEKARMPFWPTDQSVKHGPFSSVEKWQVPRVHLPRDMVLPSDNSVHPCVAVKVLKRDQFTSPGDFEQAVRLEAKVLNVMSSLEHRHLIRTIACYRKGPVECFVFPWADHGNLRDYWKDSKLVANQRLAADYLWWVFLQLRGLAEAITQLHGRIIRHGDLKPENILCFRNNAKNQRDDICRLVIADAGLAKVNYQITQLRTKASLGPKGGTLMYEPPEAEVGSGAPMSRRYDVWSMGCICLEFLIWLISGNEGLTQLVEDLNQVGRFYEPHWSKSERRTTGAGRQKEVDNRIQWLREHPLCKGEKNPLGRLVELIDKKLLVHSLGKPISLPHLSPSTLQLNGDFTPDGYTTFAPPRRRETGGLDVFELPPGSRVKSDTMLAEFDAILTDKASFRLPSATMNSSAASSLVHLPRRNIGSGRNLEVPGASRSAASRSSPGDVRIPLAPCEPRVFLP